MKVLILIAAVAAAVTSYAYAADPSGVNGIQHAHGDVARTNIGEAGHARWGTQHVNNTTDGQTNCAGGGCSQAGGTVRDDGTTNPPPGQN